MQTIRWSEIAPPGEVVHIANIQLGRMRSPAMHTHDFYECFIVLEGKGMHLTPAGSSPLAPRELYCLRPEHAHCITGAEDFSFLNVAFEAKLFHEASVLADWPEGIWKKDCNIASLQIRSKEFEQMVESAVTVAHRPSRCRAAWWLLGLARVLDERLEPIPEREALPDWFAEGLARARELTVLQEGVSELTRRMGRSRKHVTRSFKQFLGKTPTEWLAEARIERARTLLATTRLPILEIALDCGFASPSYFHKCFREAQGISPARYRRSLSRVHAS